MECSQACKLGLVDSFQTLLDNIFLPLFEVTEDPQSDPVLHTFLRAVVGLDCVDDESKPDVPLSLNNLPTPEEWTSESKSINYRAALSSLVILTGYWYSPDCWMNKWFTTNHWYHKRQNPHSYSEPKIHRSWFLCL